MERFIENTMYASRWLLAPIYLGLSIAVLLLGVKFFQEAFHTLPLVFSLKEADLVLVVLSLVDMALVGGLLVMAVSYTHLTLPTMLAQCRSRGWP